jgi:hypothetical protein
MEQALTGGNDESTPGVPPPPRLRVFAGGRAALRYHALAFVPLPEDDANLHRRGYSRAWRRLLEETGVRGADLDVCIEAARATLAAGPGRLALQADVLADPHAEPDRGPLGALESLLAPAFERAWDEALEATEICRRLFQDLLAVRGPLFAPVRLAGIDRVDVHLCPALFATGRALRLSRTYLVALPLPDDEPSGLEALLQLVHECCHPLCDDIVVPLAAAPPDTARGAPGHAGHVLREDSALVIGYHWLASDAAVRNAYLAWVSRFRPPQELERRLAEGLALPDPPRAAVLERARSAAGAVSR